MPWFVRLFQWLGLVLLVGSAFQATFHMTAYPARSFAGDASVVHQLSAGAREIPAQEFVRAAGDAVRGPSRAEPFWRARRWYPWYLALLWGVALVVAHGTERTARRRRAVGAVLWLSTAGLLVFEAAYLHAEYLAFLPGLAGRVEGVCVWLVVAAVLLWRRPADRHLGAVEAAVASQALLGFLHAMTLPATLARPWWAHHAPEAVLRAVGANFPLPFWMGVAGLLLLSVPVYACRRRVRAVVAEALPASA